jgi:CSLREA domain-containing protein
MKGIHRFIGTIAAVFCACGIGHAAPANDHWADRMTIAELPFSASVTDMATATTDITDPDVFCWWQSGDVANPGQSSVWFGRVTGDADEYVDLDAGGYDTLIAVYEGEPGRFVDVPGGCNDDGVRIGSGSILRGVRLRANTAYSIFVATYRHGSLPSRLEFSMSRSAVHRVTKTEDGDDGQCDETDCSLREAVNRSIAEPGAIVVPAGRYVVPGGLDFGAHHPGGMNLYGAGMGETVIDAAGEGRVMTFPSQDDTVQILTWGMHDLTLTNGNTTDSGGAVFAHHGYAAFERVAVTDSVASVNGGGVAVHFGAASFIGSLVAGNRAAGMGGGTYMQRYNLEVRESTFTANDAGETQTHGGGGLAVIGMYDLRLFNATISTNRSRTSAGGLYVGSTDYATMKNVSIVGNTFGKLTSETQGGGLWIGPSSRMSVFNSVLAGNHVFDDPETSSDCVLENPSELTARDNLVRVPGSCPFDEFANLIGLDPLLSPLGLYDSVLPVHLPLRESPLIDTGEAATCTDIDARGVVRPQDGDGEGTKACDMGAVEVKAPGEGIFSDGFD